MSRPPRINQIIETAVYFRDMAAADQFYGGILGLRKFSESDSHIFYAVGRTVLLVFDPNSSRAQTQLPQHGTSGAGHFAFQIEPDQYEPWLIHLKSAGVAIEKEHLWNDWKARSIYCRDPEGNAVELITRPAWEDHFD